MAALAKDDVAVRNSTTIEIIDKIGNPANRIIEIEADHTSISIDLTWAAKLSETELIS